MPRRLLALAVVVVVLAAAAAAYVLLPPWQTDDVAMPEADASPETVVKTYTDALDAHDCDTASAVMTDEAQDNATGWCEKVANLGDVEIGEPSPERPGWSGREKGDEVMHVPVTFDLDWRILHDDGSLDEGETTWGYLLVRDSPEDPWRISDQGVG